MTDSGSWWARATPGKRALVVLLVLVVVVGIAWQRLSRDEYARGLAPDSDVIEAILARDLSGEVCQEVNDCRLVVFKYAARDAHDPRRACAQVNVYESTRQEFGVQIYQKRTPRPVCGTFVSWRAPSKLREIFTNGTDARQPHVWSFEADNGWQLPRN